MTLHQAYKAASIAHAFTHNTDVVCSGNDPKGLFYHFIEADKYLKVRDGRIVETVS